MIQSHETIAVEGGAEGKAKQDAWYNLCHLLWLAIKHIPRQHRLGWWQTTMRHSRQPLTPDPSQHELDYLAWSHARHASPRANA